MIRQEAKVKVIKGGNKNERLTIDREGCITREREAKCTAFNTWDVNVVPKWQKFVKQPFFNWHDLPNFSQKKATASQVENIVFIFISSAGQKRLEPTLITPS